MTSRPTAIPESPAAAAPPAAARLRASLLRNITLRQVFILTLAVLAILLGVLFYVVLGNSEKSIIQSSGRLREEVGTRFGEHAAGFLARASNCLADVERELQFGAIAANDRDQLESAFFSKVLDDPNLSEVTLTRAARTGFDPEGAAQLAAEGRWQVSVYRLDTPHGRSAIVTRYLKQDGTTYAADVRERPVDGTLTAGVFHRQPGAMDDPTRDLTFETAARQVNRGDAIWSDLHWSDLDPIMREGQRRVEVTVQKAIEDRSGNFIGVLRVGLLEDNLDPGLSAGRPSDDPHRLFLCDNEGRLITRVTSADRIDVSGEDLRVVPGNLPPEVAAALRLPILRGLKSDSPPIGGSVTAGGRKCLVTFRPLQGSQDWIVGILAPEDYYLRDLRRTRNQMLVAALAVMAVILLGGILTLRAVQRGLARVVQSASRMRGFEFAPGETRGSFRDVREVMESLEQAKTAMRAMVKYVPVDVVRQVYNARMEPRLGGELRTVSLMFSDIRDFTAIAERLPPDVLAQALGRYFEAITAAVQASGGIVDKYIGDSVMAMWNAPDPCAGHPRRACAAALACAAATNTLFVSAAWDGLPPFHTRVGIHKDDVLVGHFGAPDRISYTAIGDGVNVASRLEGLNKLYGTSIIVSEAVKEDSAGEFRFRLLDRVAVKGTSRGVKIYELRGTVGQVQPDERIVANYENALQACWSRDFPGAIRLLKNQQSDGPSAVLSRRCGEYLRAPPATNWDGVYVASTK